MARYRSEHKAETRRRLVKSAVTTFRREGVSAAGLKEIMGELGQTVGGFYRHFPSKTELVAAAVEQGVRQSLDLMRSIPEDEQFPWAERFTAGYLSETHSRALAEGCVFAALASDIARAEPGVKQACESGLQSLHKELLNHLPPESPLANDEVWGLVALEIGGLLLSRMVESEEASTEILASCRRAARRLLGAKPRAAKIRNAESRKSSRTRAPSKKKMSRVDRRP
jgi:TetR/AcrR family transcriptional repressor of nem operon